jgi:hypothetical protein
MGNSQHRKYAYRGLPDPSPYLTEGGYETRVYVQQPAAQFPGPSRPRQKPAYISGSGARGPASRENQGELMKRGISELNENMRFEQSSCKMRTDWTKVEIDE